MIQNPGLVAAILTLAHVVRMGPALSEGSRQYSHDHVVEEFEAWLGYVSGEGEPISPLDEEESDP